MDGKIDFAKSSFAHHFPNLVVLSKGFRRATRFQECELDLLLYLKTNAAPWR